MDKKPTIFQKETFIYDNERNFVGAGEFGEVFEAKVTSSNESVALKLLNTPQRLKQIELDSLMKEACILERLRGHPNVVHLKGICVNPRHYALVLEFVDNGNLEDLLLHKRNEQPLVKEWHCRCHMGLDVARGMQFLHSQEPSIIHRDLKSSNVLVTKKYRCKISDFGLAKMRGISSQTTRKSHRSRHDPAGTLSFIAPERFTGEADPLKGQKVDVYGFAVVLWQLKEMKRPFDGEPSPAAIRENVVAGVRPRVTPSDSSPRGLQDLISSCWSNKPDDRPEFSKIVIKLVDIVESLLPDSGVADDSQPMETTNLHHSYSSSGGPLAYPSDSSGTETMQNFGSDPIPIQPKPSHPPLPEAQVYTSIYTTAASVSQTREQREPMDTVSLGSAPPTMSGQPTQVLNSQPLSTPTGGLTRSNVQPTNVQYPSTSQNTHQSYMTPQSLGQLSAFPTAGKLISEQSEPPLHSQLVIDRNPGLVTDARKLQPARIETDQPIIVEGTISCVITLEINGLPDLMCFCQIIVK
jgi:serine/threonine protein kinase